MGIDLISFFLSFYFSEIKFWTFFGCFFFFFFFFFQRPSLSLLFVVVVFGNGFK